MAIPERVKEKSQWLNVSLILVGSICIYIAIASGKESGAREAKQMLIRSACGEITGKVAVGWEKVCADKLGPDDIEVTHTVIQGE